MEYSFFPLVKAHLNGMKNLSRVLEQLVNQCRSLAVR